MLIISIIVAVTITIFSFGCFAGRKHKFHWQQKLSATICEALRIEKQDNNSQLYRTQKIIQCFSNIGFELENSDSESLSFLLNKEGTYEYRVSALTIPECIVFPYVVFIALYELGHVGGSGGAGTKGEKLIYSLDFSTPPPLIKNTRKWYEFWKDS